MQAVTGSQILILQLLLHFRFSSLHVSEFHVCDFFILCLCSNTSKEWTFLLHYLTQKARGSRITCTMTLQHFSNVANSPNICRRGIASSADQSVCSYTYCNINDSTSDSTSHTIARDNFMKHVIWLQILLLGREINASQKLGLVDKTRYTAFSPSK